MKTKKGSILLEVLACIFIVSVFGVFTASTCLKCKREYERRVEEDKVNRSVNMIVKEIKYNISKTDLDSEFEENVKIGFKYNDNLMEELQSESLFDIEKGSDIVIEKENESAEADEYVIKVNISNDIFNIEQSYKFQKSWWMDEV